MDEPKKTSPDVPILVVGGGPVGMLTALGLARLNVPCILAEQNLETTIWPKMDLTNCRTMEILRMYGLADSYRQTDGAIDAESNFDTRYHTGWGPGGRLITNRVSSHTIC